MLIYHRANPQFSPASTAIHSPHPKSLQAGKPVEVAENLRIPREAQELQLPGKKDLPKQCLKPSTWYGLWGINTVSL